MAVSNYDKISSWNHEVNQRVHLEELRRGYSGLASEQTWMYTEQGFFGYIIASRPKSKSISGKPECMIYCPTVVKGSEFSGILLSEPVTKMTRIAFGEMMKICL